MMETLIGHIKHDSNFDRILPKSMMRLLESQLSQSIVNLEKPN
jgi:hypothetical protein